MKVILLGVHVGSPDDSSYLQWRVFAEKIGLSLESNGKGVTHDDNNENSDSRLPFHKPVLPWFHISTGKRFHLLEREIIHIPDAVPEAQLTV